MKNILKTACCFCDDLKIAKHYDCSTAIKCGKKDSPCFELAFKSDFTVTPLQIVIAVSAASAVMLVTGAVCAMKHRK